MTRGFFFAIVATTFVCATCARAQAPAADSKGKTCRMEQQCRWENFQKHCVWVKVCR